MKNDDRNNEKRKEVTTILTIVVTVTIIFVLVFIMIIIISITIIILILLISIFILPGIGYAAIGVMWEMVSAWQHPELIVDANNSLLTAQAAVEGVRLRFYF